MNMYNLADMLIYAFTRYLGSSVICLKCIGVAEVIASQRYKYNKEMVLQCIQQYKANTTAMKNLPLKRKKKHPRMPQESSK